jgi:hypothetical protein
MAAGRTRKIAKTNNTAEQGHAPDCHSAGASWQPVMPERSDQSITPGSPKLFLTETVMVITMYARMF